MSLERDPVADRIASFLDALLTREVPRPAATDHQPRMPSFREFSQQQTDAERELELLQRARREVQLDGCSRRNAQPDAVRMHPDA